MNTDKESTQTKPSPGALRAAGMITGIFDDSIMKNELKGTIDRLAEIIDRETGASDLLAALEGLMEQIDNGTLVKNTSRDHEPDYTLRMVKFVSQLQKANTAIAIAKAKGESQ